MKFRQWFNSFLDEKGIDPYNTVIEFTNEKGVWNYMTLGTIYEYMINQPSKIQRKFKEKLLVIDFQNGNLLHFFKYIATYISNLIPFF